MEKTPLAKRLSVPVGLIALGIWLLGLHEVSLDLKNEILSILLLFSRLFWLAIFLFFVCISLAIREDRSSQLFVIILASVILWAIPVVIFESAYGRDAYTHWGSVKQITYFGQVEVTKYSAEYPAVFVIGTIINEIWGLSNGTSFLTFLKYFRLVPVILFPIYIYLFTIKTIKNSTLSFFATLCAMVGNVFTFPIHYSPFTLSASVFLPILLLLNATWKEHVKPTIKITWIVIFLTLVLSHLPTTLCYLFLFTLVIIFFSRHLKSLYALFIVIFLAWSMYVSTGGFHTFVNFMRVFWGVVTGINESKLTQTYGVYVYPWVSWVRRIVVFGFSLPALYITVKRLLKGRTKRIDLMFLSSVILSFAVGSTKYGEFATRVLFLVIPFSALIIFDYISIKRKNIQKRMHSLSLFIIFFSLISSLMVSYVNAYERTLSASELAGLRFLGNSIFGSKMIISPSTELLSFIDPACARDVNFINNYGQMIPTGSIIIFQQSNFWYYFLQGNEEEFCRYLNNAINNLELNRIYDAWKFVVFDDCSYDK